MIGIPAALNIRANLGCSGAAPEATAFKFPPNASFHFLKINFRAIANFIPYQVPFLLYGSHFSATPTAQKNMALNGGLNSEPVVIILSYTFSSNLGTAVITCGFTSFKLSEIVSIDSA